MGVQAIRRAEAIEIQATFDLGTFDGCVLDVVGFEGGERRGGRDRVFVNEVAVRVVEHCHVKRARIEIASQAGFIAFAFFRFQIRIGFNNVASGRVLKASVQGFGGGCTEAFGVLAVPGVVVSQRVGHAKFGRHAYARFCLRR